MVEEVTIALHESNDEITACEALLKPLSDSNKAKAEVSHQIPVPSRSSEVVMHAGQQFLQHF